MLADDLWTAPFIAYVSSVFVGVVGYSMFVAFGPGSSDLRDPFEEHED